MLVHSLVALTTAVPNGLAEDLMSIYHGIDLGIVHHYLQGLHLVENVRCGRTIEISRREWGPISRVFDEFRPFLCIAIPKAQESLRHTRRLGGQLRSDVKVSRGFV
jgi:hypothetical protein